MIARVSPDDILLYANGALAAYLNVRKSDLVGSPLEVVAARAKGEISGAFERPESGRASNRLVTDDEGRVFELKTYSEGGVLDIVLDEVTTAESVNRDLKHVSGTSVDLLDEDELRTARQPERRFMTVSRSRLTEMAHLAERLPPMETRLMLNSFVEESAECILETGCTYYQESADKVMGLFGAPRYFADHAVRAVRAACNQIERSTRLRAGFFQQGKEMPPMACGIWTGETFIGTLGSSATQQYSAIGLTVDLAAELCRIARPGEVLISEITLRHMVLNLPQGWEAIRAESESEPDLSDFQWTGDEIQPLGPDHVRGVWLIGPGVQEDSSRAEFYADYLYALKTRALDEPVPILRVVRPALIGDSLELSGDNIVSTPFAQMLGKYKLLSVVGTGGMGKVWKGQDRYGNVVAIKVLHTTETSSDAMLKRFQREAEIMSRLPHRNICRVFEMSEFEGIQFLVMEYVDGLTLADLLYERTHAEIEGSGTRALPDLRSLISAIRDERTAEAEQTETPDPGTPRIKTTRVLPIEQTLTMFLKVCDAVQFAHEHGVLHRDLKPGNILLREDGEPLVADFGLAKLRSSDATQSLSVSGHVVGTLENMSPEQAESSKDVDERADVYALGTILFQMLTGRRHFEATGNIVADAQALQTHEPPRLRSLNPRLDTDLEIIVLKALRNSPTERYRSVAALQADIERYRRGEVITAKPVTALELLSKLVLRNRAVTAVITISVLVLVAGSVAAFWKITERAKAAEVALDEARRQGELARKNELLAEEKKREAEEQRKEAMAALAERDKADQLARTARGETEAERKRREAAEIAAREASQSALGKDQELSQAQRQIEELQASQSQPDPIPEPPRRAGPIAQDPMATERANRAMSDILFSYTRELNPMELSRYERNPEPVLERINTGLDKVSGLLLADPTFTPAWIMKGRYHLACMEISQAKASFDTAARVAAKREQQNQNDFLGKDDPSDLSQLCDQVLKPGVDRFAKAAALFRSTGNPLDQIAADTINFFDGKPLMKKSALGASPADRTPSQNEIAVEILAANGGVGRVEIRPGPTERTLEISGISELNDLSAIRRLALPPTKIVIRDATSLDWNSLAAQNTLETLDLAGCRLGELPPNLRGFGRIQSLSLRDSAFSDLSFVRIMRLLSVLDISGTGITDLSPLSLCTRLQSLDLGGLPAENLRVLSMLPLARLTLSPMLIPDRASLNGLRNLRMLKVLRAPNDPENQTPAEFWRKFDAKAYETSE